MSDTPVNKNELISLRSQAQWLSPVVSIGANALSDTVLREIERQLSHHELIKIRASVDGHEELKDLAQDCSRATSSTLIDLIGRRFVLYRKQRKKDEPKELDVLDTFYHVETQTIHCFQLDFIVH